MISARSPLKDVPILVVLQSAYDKGGLKDGWHPSTWWKEFRTSRSGIRLAGMFLEEDLRWFRYCNAAPGVGKGPDSKLDPSHVNLRRRIKKVRPRYVLACGKLAEWVVQTTWGGPLVVIPHLAYRPLTNELLRGARELLVDSVMLARNSEWPEVRGLSEDTVELLESSPLRVAFRQKREHFEIERLR